ncbi:MAG: hypothetical protein WDN24_06305 [Sphingomonas sp.]
MWSLSRALDALTRKGKLQDLREALGILAYADAFQQTLMRYRRRHDDPWQFEPNAVTYRYDFTHIRESLKVQLDQVVSRRTSLSQMLVAGLTGSIAATALLASVISARNSALADKVKDMVVVPGISADALQWMATFFPIPAIVAGGFLWLVSSLLLSEDRIRAKRGERRKLAQAVRGIANSIATIEGVGRRGGPGHAPRLLHSLAGAARRGDLVRHSLCAGAGPCGRPYADRGAGTKAGPDANALEDIEGLDGTATPMPTVSRSPPAPRPSVSTSPIPKAAGGRAAAELAEPHQDAADRVAPTAQAQAAARFPRRADDAPRRAQRRPCSREIGLPSRSRVGMSCRNARSNSCAQPLLSGQSGRKRTSPACCSMSPVHKTR